MCITQINIQVVLALLRALCQHHAVRVRDGFGKVEFEDAPHSAVSADAGSANKHHDGAVLVRYTTVIGDSHF